MNDTDGDGVPDTLDACPTTPNASFGGHSYCRATTYDVRTGAVAPGSTVVLVSVHVIAVTDTSFTVSYLPGDPLYDATRSEFASLTMPFGSISAPVLGAVIQLYGEVLAEGGFTPVRMDVISTGGM